MTQLHSQTAVIDEIEAYLRGAGRYPKVSKEIRGLIPSTYARSVLRKVNQMQKQADRNHTEWIRDTESIKKLLAKTQKSVKKSKSLIKIYRKGERDVIVAFSEGKKRKARSKKR